MTTKDQESRLCKSSFVSKFKSVLWDSDCLPRSSLRKVA